MEKTNSNSITAFTLGILSIILPFIGLALGIIGLVIANKAINEVVQSSEKSSSLAVSGRILSVIGICVQALFIVLAVIAFLAYYLLATDVGSM